jgi:hypothetical protein
MLGIPHHWSKISQDSGDYPLHQHKPPAPKRFQQAQKGSNQEQKTSILETVHATYPPTWKHNLFEALFFQALKNPQQLGQKIATTPL